jgi:hypothetical protein
LTGVVELAAVLHGAIIGDLHSDRAILTACCGDRLLVDLHRLHNTKSQVVTIRDTQGCSNTQDSLLDIDTNDDGRLLVEASTFNHLDDAGEDSLVAIVHLTLLLALLNIKGEIVKQMINDVGRKDLDIFLFSELDSIRHHSHVKS